MSEVTDYATRKADLLATKAKLEKLIPETQDEIKATLLRADYRDTINKLALFYDDEPKTKNHEI